MAISIFYRELNQEKVDQAWADLIQSGFKTTPSTMVAGDLKDVFEQTDEERIVKELYRRDIELIDQLSGAKFTAPLDMQVEDAINWLFQSALGVNIEEEDFFRDNAVAGIPLELWTRLFQNLSGQAMETVKAKCKKSGNSFDKFREYLLGVKNVVKYCLDNHSDMIAFYEGAPCGTMRERAMRMYKHLVPEL